MRTTPHVLLVTDAAHLDGEPGGGQLVRALANEGLLAAWAAWDDPYVDWARAELVAVRAVHDHRARVADFVGWAGFVGSRLLHGAAAFRWSLGSTVLTDLAAAGVPVAERDAPDSRPATPVTPGTSGTSATSVLVLGGRPADVDLGRPAALLAAEAVAAAAERLGAALPCVRVELLRDGGRPRVAGVDLVSPSLDLERAPQHAVTFASLVGTLCTP